MPAFAFHFDLPAILSYSFQFPCLLTAAATPHNRTKKQKQSPESDSGPSKIQLPFRLASKFLFKNTHKLCVSYLITKLELACSLTLFKLSDQCQTLSHRHHNRCAFCSRCAVLDETYWTLTITTNDVYIHVCKIL